eukprot:2500769-Pyramimonas_sp.AAC.2
MRWGCWLHRLPDYGVLSLQNAASTSSCHQRVHKRYTRIMWLIFARTHEIILYNNDTPVSIGELTIHESGVTSVHYATPYVCLCDSCDSYGWGLRTSSFWTQAHRHLPAVGRRA